ncbi:hypothetical protein CK203_052149 [Vitis vinifera]|uniref:Uncharacterized protein n=1 Tax=Vitis vinifera TaxID=29760 RepID=A0A438GA35_VITVI|nr:hypothetical protein CK203_052149 [Vitis vinifera]
MKFLKCKRKIAMQLSHSEMERIEGPKLPVSEDIPARDEPTVEKNVEMRKTKNMRKHSSAAYAKFLKDLCTVKRRIKLSKKAFLTEQVSAIIENKAMVKYKDPGCPTISVQIGDHSWKGLC